MARVRLIPGHRSLDGGPVVAGYQLEVTLVGTRPSVWRLLDVPANLSLAQLHRVLQTAFEWRNSHLHEFTVAKRRFTPAKDRWSEDESCFTLADLGLQPGQSFQYVYDLGDSWRHEIMVKSLLTHPPLKPSCVAGERAAPPEECGGVWGYDELLEVLGNPHEAQHSHFSHWVPENFAPAVFDPITVNRALASVGT